MSLHSALRSSERFWTAAVCGVWLAGLCSAGAEVKPSESGTPSSDALTLLETYCVKCHGGEKTKGGLDLVTREALLRGGENGASVIPHDANGSLLVKMIRHEEDPGMPHKEKKLSDDAIAQIVKWVNDGVPYVRPLKKETPASGQAPAKFTITDADRSHWSFRPITRPSPPAGNSLGDDANPIDRFIAAKLATAGLKLSPPAEKTTLIRRVTLDLIGLPPTPEEVEAFANDTSPQAYEKLIDRLLASPHYGERWGRHWLDLARFAETDGFEHDAVRPHSWRYRDYVIRAFNEDKPYDRFVREQIAGDELWPADPQALTATGFNLLGPDMVDSSDQEQRHHNTLNDITDTAALTFLGLTMGCARCHDHKFEPISQRDYYSLQAFFTPAKFDRERPIPTPAEKETYEAAMSQYEARPEVRELANLEAPVRERLRERKLAKLPSEAQAAHRTPPEQRNAEQANLVLETEDKVKVSEKELAGAFSGESKARRQELITAVKKLSKPAPLPRAMALLDGAPKKTFVLRRGEYSQPEDEVSPAFPEILRPTGAAPCADGRRAALADWIASPGNPLTARVMVNRIWQHHFGRGLVPTPNDFGTHGQAPTHPELLNWLASEFIARGWSVKAMHKLILLSATYRQSSVVSPAARAADPENKFYSRMSRVRLEGETIRDSLLAISGQLNPKMGGPGVFPPIPKEIFAGAKGWPVNDSASDYSRRSIYIFSRRNLRFPFLEVFDAPDSNLSCPVRERSTTAPQALTLLNADEVMIAAKLTAERLKREAASTDDQIVLAYRLTLARAPTSREAAISRDFLAQAPLEELCRALFNLNDFIYVE
jgi:mono/diheme cytochrome c family protein